MAERFVRVLAELDRRNGEDPTLETDGAVQRPRELVHAERVTAWVLRLNPAASEALRIAARGQHVARWTIPREQYPRTRAGYLRWRETLKAFHMREVGTLMAAAGYAPEEIARVQAIMSKRSLPRDPESQTLEDALCLVFLETQMAAFRQRTPADTLLSILRKTWAKMSPAAQAAARALPLGPEERALLARALEGERA